MNGWLAVERTPLAKSVVAAAIFGSAVGIVNSEFVTVTFPCPA